MNPVSPQLAASPQSSAGSPRPGVPCPGVRSHLPLRLSTAIPGLALSACWLLTGCGTPGAPQPPSLHLPIPVSDFSAVRSGNVVDLHWANPRKTTDRLLLKGSIHARICWQNAAGPCEIVETVNVDPGSKVDFRESLPPELRQGAPHPVSYFVELKNQLGRSAGPSNLATILAGSAPAPITDFRAEVRAEGAALLWNGNEKALVRLHRTLLTPSRAEKSDKNIMGSQAEPTLRDFLVESSRDGAIDRTARFGETYEYTAQRLIRVPNNGQTVELAGDLSAPVRVEMKDSFPPAPPSGLEAVAVPDDKTIDLSWQPGSDNDLAGYIVYRTTGQSSWTRISGGEPLFSPAFRDTTAQPGQAYRYAVTAIDQTGHESARSPETTETLPHP